MRKVAIEEIWIDEKSRLLVRLADPTVTLDQIFRSATGVTWDGELRAVCSPVPRSWTHTEWFVQIVRDAKSEYGIELAIQESTKWISVQEGQRASMREALARPPPRDQAPVSDVEMATSAGDLHLRERARDLFEEKRWHEVVLTLEGLRYPKLLKPSERRRLEVARSRARNRSHELQLFRKPRMSRQRLLATIVLLLLVIAGCALAFLLASPLEPGARARAGAIEFEVRSLEAGSLRVFPIAPSSGGRPGAAVVAVRSGQGNVTFWMFPLLDGLVVMPHASWSDLAAQCDRLEVSGATPLASEEIRCAASTASPDSFGRWRWRLDGTPVSANLPRLMPAKVGLVRGRYLFGASDWER